MPRVLFSCRPNAQVHQTSSGAVEIVMHKTRRSSRISVHAPAAKSPARTHSCKKRLIQACTRSRVTQVHPAVSPPPPPALTVLPPAPRQRRTQSWSRSHCQSRCCCPSRCCSRWSCWSPPPRTSSSLPPHHRCWQPRNEKPADREEGRGFMEAALHAHAQRRSISAGCL